MKNRHRTETYKISMQPVEFNLTHQLSRGLFAMPGFMEFLINLSLVYHRSPQTVSKIHQKYKVYKVHIEFSSTYGSYFFNSAFS